MSTAPTNPDAPPTADRWLTVHALTEFVFCPRAGLLAVETNSLDEHERPHTNLDFSLPYTLEELDTRLNRALNRLWRWAALVALLFFVAFAAWWHGRQGVLLTAGVAIMVVATPASRRVSNVIALVEQRREILSRETKAMPFQEPGSQSVDWWDALRAGWMSVRGHESYRDEELRLSGRPWRVLRHGSVSVPVFRLTHYDPAMGPRIFPQHVVRMAAYCHLVETCEGRESPCGVVLFGDTYRGMTVPNTAEAQNALRRELQMTRRVVQESELDLKDPPPAPPAHCSGCLPWGLPRVYKEGQTESERDGEVIPVYGTTGPDRQLYHSPCGDRFEWVPPHDEACRRGMA